MNYINFQQQDFNGSIIESVVVACKWSEIGRMSCRSCDVNEDLSMVKLDEFPSCQEFYLELVARLQANFYDCLGSCLAQLENFKEWMKENFKEFFFQRKIQFLTHYPIFAENAVFDFFFQCYLCHSYLICSLLPLIYYNLSSHQSIKMN